MRGQGRGAEARAAVSWRLGLGENSVASGFRFLRAAVLFCW